MNLEIRHALDRWFEEPGAYVLVDGQYGSTGKGLIAGALAECFWQRVDFVVSNAGPNSGHTSYYKNARIVLKQLPTFSVVARYSSLMQDRIVTMLSAGAVINRTVLRRELLAHNILRLDVHPAAAIIEEESVDLDQINVYNIASTGQGVGPALERKLRRVPEAIYAIQQPMEHYTRRGIYFLEIPQGHSLGINSGFYPHVTARECSASQALSDAGMPPSFHRKTIMSVRTFPVRVGNTENSSGPHYEDQEETSWEALGVEPELTTVTGRVRRIFTWSHEQYRQALLVNDPSVVFLNFVNYLNEHDVDNFVIDNVLRPYQNVFGRNPEAILLGFGPRSSDIFVWSIEKRTT